MTPPTDLSPATAARLRSLRWRVTALIALLATVAVSVFAVVVVRLDRQLRDEQIDTELLRLGDEAGREVSFVDDALEPADPVLDGVVLAVNPSFSVAEFEQQADRLDLPDPSLDELRESMAGAFEDADLDVRVFLIEELLADIEVPALVEEIDVAALVEDGAASVEQFEYEDDGELRTYGDAEFFLDDLVGVLVDDPPDELFDEAYRRWVVDTVDEREQELDFGTEYLVADDVDLAEEELGDIANQVTEDDVPVVRETLPAGDGGVRVVRATALRDGPEVRGAVVAVLDPGEFDDAHASLRNQVVLLALGIVAIAVIAAWFVAGRTTRPVARALGQQERFLADAAHELRTPIAAIRLTAESSSPSTAEEGLGRVAELAADASTLTDDLLTLARMDADRLVLQRDRVRLDLLVEATVATIPGADDAVVISPSNSPVVEADPGLVERALGNLVRNALAHGGASAEAPATVTIVERADSLVVRVSDRGPGLEDGVAEELFERFRSRTGSSGHGLGLPLARWIARAHGGDLVVVGTEGAGVAFDLSLPL